MSFCQAIFTAFYRLHFDPASLCLNLLKGPHYKVSNKIMNFQNVFKKKQQQLRSGNRNLIDLKIPFLASQLHFFFQNFVYFLQPSVYGNGERRKKAKTYICQNPNTSQKIYIPYFFLYIKTFYMTHETHVKKFKIFFIFIAHSVRVYTVLNSSYFFWQCAGQIINCLGPQPSSRL